MELRLAATSVFGEEKNGARPFRPYIQHLASHNVSAGRIVTKMQFDLDATYPKLVFSPVSAVPESDLEIIAQQAQSKEAERAITISVHKDPVKATEQQFLESLVTPAPAPAPAPAPQAFVETVEAPQAFVETVEAPQAFVEPVVRTTAPTETNKANDVADIVKKWSTT
jgi:hypothetical protein